MHEVEIAKWDSLAVGVSRDQLWVKDADFQAYARRVSTMVGIAEFLGDLRGREVLELGCGKGELTTLLARSGANVKAIDISSGSVQVARRRAELHGVQRSIEFFVGVGEDLPFEDEQFDVVVGKGVLHHLDVRRAGPELHRVLRPGGRAAFSEPLGSNPLLSFARDHLPYPHKNPRGADVPLRTKDVRAWEAPFSKAEHREIQLLAMLERALGSRKLPRLRRLDAVLLRRFPALRPLCRYIVMTLIK